jgi:hypothetical protein
VYEVEATLPGVDAATAHQCRYPAGRLPTPAEERDLAAALATGPGAGAQ